MMRINFLDRVEFVPPSCAVSVTDSGDIPDMSPFRRRTVWDRIMVELGPRLGGPAAEPHSINGWMRTLSGAEWARMVEAHVPSSMVEYPEMWVALSVLVGGLGIAAMLVSDYILDAKWRDILELCGESAAACVGGCLASRRLGERPEPAQILVGGYLPASTKDTVATLVELARSGERETFVEIAAMNGVPKDQLGDLWAGTVKRVNREAAQGRQGDHA